MSALGLEGKILHLLHLITEGGGNKATGSLEPTLLPTMQCSSSTRPRADNGRVRPNNKSGAQHSRSSRADPRLDRSTPPFALGQLAGRPVRTPETHRPTTMVRP